MGEERYIGNDLKEGGRGMSEILFRPCLEELRETYNPHPWHPVAWNGNRGQHRYALEDATELDKTKLCGFSTQANYTDRATAPCRRS
jgi:hypothetical protein